MCLLPEWESCSLGPVWLEPRASGAVKASAARSHSSGTRHSISARRDWRLAPPAVVVIVGHFVRSVLGKREAGRSSCSHHSAAAAGKEKTESRDITELLWLEETDLKAGYRSDRPAAGADDDETELFIDARRTHQSARSSHIPLN